ncbi:MAG: hypothetical protein HXX20_24995, partial [Chloroflexi bacterium]|nr:hypothetical protein [Chloroflexota bacterium]
EVVTGFWLKTEWLWRKPLPEVEDILLEVGGDNYINYLTEKFRRYKSLP